MSKIAEANAFAIISSWIAFEKCKACSDQNSQTNFLTDIALERIDIFYVDESIKSLRIGNGFFDPNSQTCCTVTNCQLFKTEINSLW